MITMHCAVGPHKTSAVGETSARICMSRDIAKIWEKFCTSMHIQHGPRQHKMSVHAFTPCTTGLQKGKLAAACCYYCRLRTQSQSKQSHQLVRKEPSQPSKHAQKE